MEMFQFRILVWFCSQDCATNYEKKYDINFARTKNGKIDYYVDSF